MWYNNGAKEDVVKSKTTKVITYGGVYHVQTGFNEQCRNQTY